MNNWRNLVVRGLRQFLLLRSFILPMIGSLLGVLVGSYVFGSKEAYLVVGFLESVLYMRPGRQFLYR